MSEIAALGIDYTNGELLVEPMDGDAFGELLEVGLLRNGNEIRASAEVASFGRSSKEEVELGPIVDLRIPTAAGWTFLVNGDDPDYKDIIEVLRPLSAHRGMADSGSPLVFHEEDDWFDWLLANYSPLGPSRLPHYVLIVGGPDQVPFHFQAFLDTAASVGRIDLTMDQLESYVAKLLRLESADEPVADRRALIFATDHGMRAEGAFDPTHFSRLHMAEPLADHVRNTLAVETMCLMGEEATKHSLLDGIRTAKPALLYTASHGMGAPKEEVDVQEAFNGAIVCARTGGEGSQRDWLVSAEDVREDEPFLEGAVVFQFACFGYGTPAESDFMHWLGVPQVDSKKDFVAALPKRLLALPMGPVAFIGHVDLAWLHGFDDPSSPELTQRWHRRVAPFVTAVNRLLSAEPVGRAMTDMNDRYSATNAILTGAWDKLKRKRVEPTAEFRAKLTSTFITRSDAQNYMVFGDPAAHVRMPD